MLSHAKKMVELLVEQGWERDMCQACFNAVATHLPKIAESDYLQLLLGATAFPAGEPEIVTEQVMELSRKTDGTLQSCLAFADAETERVMAEFHEHQEAQ